MADHPLTDSSALLSGLTTPLAATRWGQVEVVDTTGSTNHDVAQRALAGQPEGLVLITGHQQAGRGRFDRQWSAPAGASVAVSALVRPERLMPDWTWLPLVTGLAVVRGLRATADRAGLPPSVAERLQLKWPNDVLITTDGPGGGKVCGILCERHENRQGAAAVLGFGINLTMTENELPVPTATSLLLAGIDIASTAQLAAAMLVEVLTELDLLLTVWQQRGHVREAYRAACGSLGVPLRVQISESEVVTGVGEDIDAQGRLVVATEQGRRVFAAGDVVHLRRG